MGLHLMDFGDGGAADRIQVYGIGSTECPPGTASGANAPERTEVPVELKTTTGQLFLYPNAQSGVLTVALPEAPAAAVTLRLFDVDGRLVLETTLAEQLGQLEVSALQAGVYALQMIDQQGRKVAVERVVKR
jgi:Secretion system C-terminal sorting domain